MSRVYLLIMLVNVIFYNIHAQTIIIKSDTIWNSDTISVYSNIIVDTNTVLTVLPGTYIEFHGNYSIDIYGSIKAIGNKMDSIYFSINDTTSFSDTATYAGGWVGISLIGCDTCSSIFSFCKLSYAKAIEPGTQAIDKENCNLKGGAIHAYNYGGIEISNCVFEHNWATYEGGAVFARNLDYVLINRSTFFENKTLVNGGGSSLSNCDEVIVENSLFVRNCSYREVETPIGIAKSGNGGSLNIVNCYPKVIISNSRFFNNKAISGTIYEANTRTMIISNAIANNFGVALYNGRGFGNQIYQNNTVCFNSNPGGTCAGLMYGSEDIELINNIFWRNDNDSAYPYRREIFGIGIDNQSALSKNNCMTYGTYGEGSIDDYPQFTNPTQGAGIEYDGLAADWTLLNTSPCVNTGTPDTTGLNLPEVDIAGNPRIYGGRIDMGAYENQYVHIMKNNSLVGSEIKLYPNPGTGRIYIDIPAEVEGAFIDIVDGQGKVLMHEQIRFSPSVLSPDKLKSGIYFYRIYKTGEVVKSGKWVKW